MQALSSTELFRRNLTEQPVLFEEHSGVRKVILNRPSKLNSLTFEMVSQMFSKLKIYEDDRTVNFVILKGNGKAFCAGGDVVGNMCYMLTGHWSFGASFYKKQLTLDHLIATYKKPLVCLINGVVMGGGAGISMHGSFRVVTEKTVFAMPEAILGLFPDVGASHFLSKLPGYFGEYVGLTGARVDGATMVACGLATHFVFSKDLPLLEHTLSSVDPSNAAEILYVINKFAHKSNTKEEELHKRLKSINRCFSRQTVEGILHFLEKELRDNLAEKWIADAVNNMKSASPTSLKVFLRSIREGRGQTIEQCLAREYTVFCNIVRRKITNDYYEGSRAIFFDKDKKPKWEPAKLELVTTETVDMIFKASEDDDDWNCLQLHARSSNLLDHARSKL
ncbi:probable 3-hydroxyisobutyryl-CoA hydrolase 3 [Syzygium oleosum]|uniref:probable 3-hydroxyisobutyryl-CoA hydrolase 3 n=1 Tax=Syzygium oleosum TaxID=219896 RepID=UPI0011D21CB0|nr:probable 3-hydroxyisobutyryl-CoA hydrolase 3 [Syzygium oleosum]